MDNRGTECTRGMTVQRWMQRWLEGEVQWRVKTSTYQTYLRHFKCYIHPLLGHMDMARLTADDVRSMLLALHKRGLSSNTACCALRLLRAAMDSAVEEGVLIKNPCRKIRLTPERYKEQRVLSRAEQEMLRQQSGPDDVPALLALYTGMRLGEICALQWQDVDWERKTIIVRRTVQRMLRVENGSSKTMLVVGTPKTLKSKRVIPAPDFLLQALERLGAASRSKWIFSHSAQAAEPRTIQRRFARLALRLGMMGVHFHTLRHTFATRMLELGIDVKTVSTLLGHSSAKTTLDLYAHSLIEHQRLAMEKLCAVR